jgi:ParB family chromosome partitioning protein
MRDTCRPTKIKMRIAGEGSLRVERGFVRPEDETPVEPVSVEGDDADGVVTTTAPSSTDAPAHRAVITIGGASGAVPETAEDENTIRSLSDRLVTELTAHRTLALRDSVANEPQFAFLAVLHALCLSAFYRSGASSCLEITAKQSGFSAQAPGLAETASAQAIDARHAQWGKQLPEQPAELWDVLMGFDYDRQAALFAHCAALTINVVREPWNRRADALAHGDQLARAVNLDMVAAGWKPTEENYFGRVPKARILEAVREGRGETSVQLIDHLKKAEMAKEAERLLEGAGWLAEPLRVMGTDAVDSAATLPDEGVPLPAFLAGKEAQEDGADEVDHAGGGARYHDAPLDPASQAVAAA